MAEVEKKRLHAEHDITKLKVMQSENDSKAAKYAMSVGAASIAETVTYPLDLTKTRLQLQGKQSCDSFFELSFHCQLS